MTKKKKKKKEYRFQDQEQVPIKGRNIIHKVKGGRKIGGLS